MKKILSFILVLLLLITFTSCTIVNKFLKKQEPAPVENIEPIDPNFPIPIGEIEILEAPQRVVCLTPSLVEQVYDLGLEDSLVGVSEFTLYPTQATQLPPVGTALLPDIDEIIALGADLVLSSAPLLPVYEEALEQDGIALLVLTPPQDLDSLWQTYETIGLALKGTEEGGALGSQFTAGLQGWFQAFAAETKNQEPLSVAYFRRLPFILATGDSFEGQLFNQMGLRNIGEDGSQWIYPEEKASGDGLKDFQALDYLLFSESELTIKDFEKSSFYAGLPATLEDRFIIIDNPALEGRGVRMFKELLNIAEAAWPEATFAPFSFEHESAPAPPTTPSGGAGTLEPDSSEAEAFTEEDIQDAL